MVILDNELKQYENMWTDAYLASENFPSQPMFYLFQGIAGLKTGKYSDAPGPNSFISRLPPCG